VLTRVEVVNSLVDWDALRSYPGEFYLNAFNLRSGTLELFDKRTLDHEAFYAALALPWLYSPTQVRNVLYTEGAAHDPSALEALLRHDQPGRAAPGTKDLESIVVLDTIGPDLWTDPEDTYEALQLTIMDPIVTLAENVSAFYALQEWIWNTLQVPQPKIYRLRFDVPSWERGRMLQWGYENALTLWDIGYESAQKFCDALLAQPVAAPPPVEQYRYLSAVLTPNSRVEDFLGVFGVKAPGPAPPPGGP
jgi:predicted acylesterase/phospholipase RssA